MMSSYWSSWVLGYGLMSFISALITVGVGSLEDIYAFSHCSFMIQVVLLALYTLSSCILLLAVATSMPTSALNFIKFFYLAFVTFFCLFVSMLDDWQDSEDPTFSLVGLVFYSIFPFFQFGRGFDVILHTTWWQGYTPGVNETIGDFTWENVGDGLEAVEYTDREHTKMYTPAGLDEAFLWLLFNVFFYYILAWYLSQVLAGDAGANEPPLFFLDKKYVASEAKRAGLRTSLRPPKKENEGRRG